MSAPETATASDSLRPIPVDRIDANKENPRLIFPQEELDRLAESISREGVLVPVVVFEKGDRFTLIDGERRLRCAQMLGLKEIPAVVSRERSARENLVQMFNIHLVREPWQDMPTAWALGKLIKEAEEKEGRPLTMGEISDLTGLSKERIQRLRHALELPPEYQKYINEGTIPLNWFWELKRCVIDPLGKQRPTLLNEFKVDEVTKAFVAKRLRGLISDTVSLRDVRPIINYAAKDAEASGKNESVLDGTLRQLITDDDFTIQTAYEDTVQIMVEADKLERQTTNTVLTFQRLLSRVRNEEEAGYVKTIGQKLIDGIRALLA